MKKFLNIFYNISRKIGKRNFVLILFVFIVLLITGLYQTFSLYTESGGVSLVDGVKTYSFILNANNSTNSVTIAAGNSKNIDITVSNDSEAELKYGLYYSSNDDLSNIKIGYLKSSAYLPNDIIKKNNSHVISLRVDNNSSNYVTINFGIKYGFNNDTELILEENEFFVDEFSKINEPNLDKGNLIPVYYDEKEGEYGGWKKADSNNVNNSWYDYDNKKWANAVIIADETKKTTYQSAEVGTIIDDADITAFYVWIPRFKYRVWNINRQGDSESTYSYLAYTKGIQIEFENGTASTGNVTCNYDDQTDSSETYLSDNCSVNGIKINNNTNNLNYGKDNQAWYTHPAFTFGEDADKDKTGFWIAKFETSGEVNSDNIASTPKAIPDVNPLISQNISEQFMSSKNFQKYLPNSLLDAHMLTNLEWGAVAYLTHSIYGLCEENTCNGLYNNNSQHTEGFFTGRSSGDIAESTIDFDHLFGTYNYKGYLLKENAPTNTKEVNKVASTTKNITGVYDLSGGPNENVMGNAVNYSKAFEPLEAGDAWNDSIWYDNVNNKLNSKYYNSYAYSDKDTGAIAFNKARLGDATAEVLGNTIDNSSWKVGSDITGSSSIFVSKNGTWFQRGGMQNDATAGIFSFNSNNGKTDLIGYSFRSTLS